MHHRCLLRPRDVLLFVVVLPGESISHDIVHPWHMCDLGAEFRDEGQLVSLSVRDRVLRLQKGTGQGSLIGENAEVSTLQDMPEMQN